MLIGCCRWIAGLHAEEGNDYWRQKDGDICWYSEPNFRKIYPEYSDLSIGDLSDRMHTKFFPMPSTQCGGIHAQVGSERQCLKPKDSFRDCPECPEMVVMPAGEFMMGSDEGAMNVKPVRKVTIAKPFAVGKFEITFTEWEACVAAGG